MSDKNFRKKLTIINGRAEAWAYYSRSGKSVEVYLRPLDENGRRILTTSIGVRVPCYPPQFKKGDTR